MIRFLVTGALCFGELSGDAQVDSIYQVSQVTLQAMLTGTTSPDLAKAVYVVENAYLDGLLNLQRYNAELDLLQGVATAWKKVNRFPDYTAPDSSAFKANAALFKVMTDTIFLADGVPASIPLSFDTTDTFGITDHSQTFISKLLATKSGNCRSLTLLYKILSDRIGGQSWIAIAPNHMYIKSFAKQNGWYNTELTSRGFPHDAWIMSSCYVHPDAIRSGMYMDTLSLQQTIAMCLVDLALGYNRKVPNHDGRFVLQCLETALEHYPSYPPAHLLRLDILASSPPSGAIDSLQLVELARTVYDIGYRQVPDQLFDQWIRERRSYQGTQKYQSLEKSGK